MPSNVEIKARAGDPGSLERRAAELADHGPELLIQEDVFFESPQGRLKLRRFPDGRGELIYYERPDAAGPKTSLYSVFETMDAAGLQHCLESALEVRGTVRKQRRLYLVGPTRIHLDRVEGLGSFVELEVVLEPEQDESDGVAVARQLMRSLGIPAEDLIDAAYIDLLEGGPAAHRNGLPGDPDPGKRGV